MKCGSLRNAMGECDSEVNFLFVRLKRLICGGEHAVGEGCNGLAWMLSVDAKLIEVLV